jgi:hypothetical protein
MKPFAPRLEYQGPGGELNRLLRSAVSLLSMFEIPSKARACIAARSELVLS